MTTTINISDEEQSTEQPPNGTRIEGVQPDEARVEQSEGVGSEQPEGAGREQPKGAREEPRADATGGDRKEQQQE